MSQAVRTFEIGAHGRVPTRVHLRITLWLRSHRQATHPCARPYEHSVLCKLKIQGTHDHVSHTAETHARVSARMLNSIHFVSQKLRCRWHTTETNAHDIDCVSHMAYTHTHLCVYLCGQNKDYLPSYLPSSFTHTQSNGINHGIFRQPKHPQNNAKSCHLIIHTQHIYNIIFCQNQIIPSSHSISFNMATNNMHNFT